MKKNVTKFFYYTHTH